MVSKLLTLAFLLNQVLASIHLGENQVFAGKDKAAFTRSLETGNAFGESPVTLAYVNENLFFVNEGEVFDEEIDFIVWSLILNGEEILQRRSAVSDGTFLLEAGLGLLNTSAADGSPVEDEFIKSKKGRSNFFTVSIIEPETLVLPEVVEEARVFQITKFKSFLPLVLIVVFAILCRNVYVAMFFGIWIGSIIIAEGNISVGLKDLFDVHIIPSVTDDANFRTIVFTLFLGGFLALIKKSGGQDGFSNFVSKYATTAKKAQLAAVGCGFGLFFDDYSSVLILGASFKGIMDGFHVSREKLAFVADATSAPIASIAPISSWIAFELGLIKAELQDIVDNSVFETRLDLPGDYPFFLNTIPSRYYPFLMLVVQVTLIAAGIEFGPMLYAERRTRLGKRTDGGDARMDIPMEQDYTTPAEDTPKKAWNFFIPLGFFLFTLLLSLINVGLDNINLENSLAEVESDRIDKNLREIFGNTNSFESLVYTTMGGSLFCMIFFLVQFKKDGEIIVPTVDALKNAIDCRVKSDEDLVAEEGISLVHSKTDTSKERPILYFTESANIWVEGFKNLVPAILILSMAFSIKSIVTGLATDRVFTEIIIESNLDPGSLPTLIFIVSTLLALATGTSFGTMSIMFPLVSFATFESSGGDVDLFTVALSSIMAGAVCGDHISPISDTTILSSIGAGCQIGAHVYTQLPYALWAALFSILFGTLPAGYGANAILMLLISSIILCVATILVGAPIVAESGRLDVFSEFVLKYTKSEGMQKYKDQTKAFAEENPILIDEEPLAVFSRCCPWASEMFERLPFGKKDSFDADEGLSKDEETRTL